MNRRVPCNLTVAESGLPLMKFGILLPRQVSRVCFLHKMDMERIWNAYCQWNRKKMFKLFKAWTWELFHEEAWIVLYGFDGNNPSVPTANNNARCRLETWFRYGHVLRDTFSWRLPGIIHVKLSHYDFGDKASFPVWLSSPSQ